MTQVISILQKVQQPGRHRSQYQDNNRRAYMVYEVLDAWNHTDHGTKEKLIAGEWARSDLRFVLPVLAEIHTKKLSPEPTGADIVKLSGEVPWIGIPSMT